MNKFNVSIVGEKYLLTQIYNAENGSVPAIQYEYDSLQWVKEARDAVALQVGGRNPYQFFLAEHCAVSGWIRPAASTRCSLTVTSTRSVMRVG